MPYGGPSAEHKRDGKVEALTLREIRFYVGARVAGVNGDSDRETIELGRGEGSHRKLRNNGTLQIIESEISSLTTLHPEIF
jgi:hypothetical protein